MTSFTTPAVGLPSRWYSGLWTYRSLRRVAEVLPGKLGRSTQFLFNAKNLVVFGQPFRSARCTSFDLQEKNFILYEWFNSEIVENRKYYVSRSFSNTHKIEQKHCLFSVCFAKFLLLHNNFWVKCVVLAKTCLENQM